MGFLPSILQGFATIVNVYSLLSITIGVMLGVFIGCLPGLSGTMAVAIITPLTFTMSPQIGITLLLGVFVGAIYGGSISAILIGTPGTPGSIVTVFDGYAMAKKGNAGKALYTALLFSVFGGIVSALFLISIAPPLSKIALQFGPREYFGLVLFGISIIASLCGKNPLKGLIVGLLGITFALIGLDLTSGVSRFTIGIFDLNAGLNLMSVLIGYFAVSEVLMMASQMVKTRKTVNVEDKTFYGLKEYKGHWWCAIKSSVIGVVIGIIPGAGAAIASFVSYDAAKKSSKNSKDFGSGCIEGIIASEAANNATTGGALIPMMTLGIPGDPVTAVLIGSFMIQGLQPGPLLFQYNSEVVYSLLAGFLIANIILYFIGLLGIKLFSKISVVPSSIIAPCVMVLCMVGTYAVRNNMMDVIIMLIMGVIGFILKKHEFPAGPFVIGFILGPILEKSLRQALTASRGDWSTFFGSPVCVGFMLLTLFTYLNPVIKKVFAGIKAKA